MAKITPTIDPEFQAELFEQTDDEKRILREQLIAEGCRDPIDVWNTKGYPILDGHTRFEICNGEGIPYATRLVDLPDRDAALDWIDRHQSGRRNLTVAQRTLVIGRMYNRRKGDPCENLKKGPNSPKYQNDTSGNAAAEIAEEHGVSVLTVKRAGEFAEAADELVEKAPELKEAVERGVIPKSNIPGLQKASKARLKRLAGLKGAELKKASWTCLHCGGDKKDDDGACIKCREPAEVKAKSGEQKQDPRLWKRIEESLGAALRMTGDLNRSYPHGVMHKMLRANIKQAMADLDGWKKAVQ